MKRKIVYFFIGIFFFLIIFARPVEAARRAVQASVFPTVTSSPSGPFITVKMDSDQTQINVRSGPATYYDKVGVLLAGQQAPAKGRTPGGDWILIEYPGVQGGVAWVYAPLVNISTGTLPIVEPPPTPTPRITATIDPTLAAQFIVTNVPTRLPTYTAPPPLVVPTFVDQSMLTTVAGMPIGLIILIFVFIGLIMGLISIVQGR